MSKMFLDRYNYLSINSSIVDILSLGQCRFGALLIPEPHVNPPAGQEETFSAFSAFGHQMHLPTCSGEGDN
jgi:hypothetical protein